MWEDAGYVGRHSTTVVSKLHAGSCLSRVVVVGGEAQLDLAGRQIVIFQHVGIDEVLGWSTLEYLHETVLIVPAVVHVKAANGEIVGVLALCQHHNLTWGCSLAQLCDGVFPKIGRYPVCHIATEAVDTHIYNPEFHGIDHGGAHVFVVIV